ncbi:CRISPR-associated endonuclease Cas2 [Frankia sp. CiP3]|uniref:CRISPR-associated endonuclease Cas2 n=1 Tax=Frankia sp. CiP3 TaxID=2880971 RepID=UPI001EF6E5C6|nr:CRISPR-associated endonuclease Cas2 [Frankia sp. CiP3]
MTATRLGYVVTFDISSDAYRRRVGSVLERNGPRILRSVYDIEIPAPRLERLTDRLVDLIETGDHVLVLPYCTDCTSSWLGMPMDAPPVNGWIVAP